MKPAPLCCTQKQNRGPVPGPKGCWWCLGCCRPLPGHLQARWLSRGLGPSKQRHLPTWAPSVCRRWAADGAGHPLGHAEPRRGLAGLEPPRPQHHAGVSGPRALPGALLRPRLQPPVPAAGRLLRAPQLRRGWPQGLPGRLDGRRVHAGYVPGLGWGCVGWSCSGERTQQDPAVSLSCSRLPPGLPRDARVLQPSRRVQVSDVGAAGLVSRSALPRCCQSSRNTRHGDGDLRSQPGPSELLLGGLSYPFPASSPTAFVRVRKRPESPPRGLGFSWEEEAGPVPYVRPTEVVASGGGLVEVLVSTRLHLLKLSGLKKE